MQLTATVLALSLVSASISARAVAAKDAAVSVMPESNVSGCPVALRATQISSPNTMQVRRGEPQQIGQRLHLAFTDRDSRQIVAATVAVRGFTFTPGLRNALSKPEKEGSSQVTRTIHIAFQAGTSVAGDIVVPGVSAAQTIDLVSLGYADGAGWKLAEGESCRIAPDPLLLIAGR